MNMLLFVYHKRSILINKDRKLGVMKFRFKYCFLALLIVAVLATSIWAIIPTNAVSSAENENITCTVASGNYLNEDYLSVYKIPTSMMTYEANGGSAGNNLISNAFDGNWNTFWQTGNENKTQGSANPDFLNSITVIFSQAVTIGSIVYASSSARLGHGYPIVLNIYTANEGELELYGTCNSDATSDRVVFALKETVTVTQIKFEFRKVNTMHNWTATAKEICFLQPDNESANNVLDLFGDYAQYTVKEEYKASLSEMRANVIDLISYESALKPLLDRAESIVNGELVWDSRREFSTNPNAENVINQYGNLRAYASGTLKMSSFGINRQVLGVGGLTGQTITIYVEADPGDPLPTIVFTQVYGDWRSWQSSRTLSIGKNTFTVPNFVTENYTREVVPGGPIHIVNAYEPSQQSSNVKIYVEGGYLYPVFRKGGNVDSFKEDLTAYYNEMQNTEGMSDVVELVGDRFINTVSASLAYTNYISGNVNPQKSTENWDNYITALIEFGGVSMDPTDEHYNEKNLHLYTNFRMVQPWAGAAAFAAGDHIGFITFSESTLVNFTGGAGWGVAHEIGHALDINGRTIGETTNNMWSKFALAYFNHDVSRNFNASMTNALTPDEAIVDGYFNTNRYNYQIWWNLEAVHHGFWGNLDNMYRYYNEIEARTNAGVTAEDGNLSTTERMVYFSSLVVGENLGYYYERFGFSFNSDDSFKVETASNAYKKLVAKALEDGTIIEKGYKYWYIDANQYFYDYSDGSCYNPSSSVEIRDVWKTSSGYTLILPETTDNLAHLGYEIMEYRNGNWYVIGFTYSASYTDTTAYEDGYVPQYKIRAYDRGLMNSAESEPVTFDESKQTGVCRIGEVYYDSLSEAIVAANANDTIYLCADLYDVAMTIAKNITILPDPTVTENLVITKRGIGPMFTVNSGVTFTLGDNNGAKIILDGNSFTQNGALIRINGGTLRVYNAELRNNFNSDHGGAVYNTGNSTFTNVTMKDNITLINGGAIANFSGGIVTLTDCLVSGNTAKGNGGAITVDGKTSLIRTTVTANTAVNGGAMYIASNNNARSVSIEGCEISGNIVSGKVSLIYLEKGILTLGSANSETLLSGGIYNNTGSINVGTALLDLSNVTFYVPSVAKGMILLTASGNVSFTEEFLANVKVDSAVAYLGDGNKTILVKPLPVLTIIVDGNDISQQVTPGDFILPDTLESIDESKYITAWECNGVIYEVGATIEITDDCEVIPVFADKYTVTVKYSEENIQTYYVIPNESFVLSNCTAPEGKEFSHWDVSGKLFNAGDTVTITGDTEVTAVYKNKSNGNANTPTTPSNPTDGNGDISKTVIIVIVVVVVVLVVSSMLIAVIIAKKRKNSK